MSSKPAAAADAKGQNEPSMEEILASIRRIIADDSLGTKKDEPAPPPAPVAKAPEPEPEPDDEDADVLDLASVSKVTLPEPVPVVEAPLPYEPVDVMVEEPEPAPEPSFSMPSFAIPAPPAAPPAPPMRNVAELEDRILSQETGSLVSDAFQALSRTAAMPAVGRSLEDVVVELLRPMMRQWLDNHLPGIVERLVKAEIERVARGS